MKKLNLRTEIMIWFIMLLPLIMYLFLKDKLPDKIPSHYNFQGNADHFRSPLNYVLVNWGIMLFVYLVILFAPYFDPKKKLDENYGKYFTAIRITIPMFMAVLTGFEFARGIGLIAINSMIVVTFFVLLLFLVLGNYLHAVRPNWFIGFRSPWTLSNDVVWTKTHRLGSKLMFYSAAVGLVLMFIIPVESLGYLLFSVVITGTIIPYVYSFVIYKKLHP